MSARDGNHARDEVMRQPARPSLRRQMIGGAIVLLLGVLAVAVSRPRPDPWPARAVVVGPPGGKLLDWGNDDRMVFGDRVTVVAINPTSGESQTRLADGLLAGRASSRDRRHFVATDLLANDAHQVAWGDAASGAVEARFGDPGLQAFRPAVEPGERSVRAFLRDARWPNRIRQVATWDVATGAESRRPVTGPSWADPRTDGEVVAPDGRTIAYLDRATHGVQLWDVDADRPIGGPFAAGSTPLAPAEGSTFTPDGQRLVLTRGDGRAEVWGRDGTLVRRFVVHAGFRTLLAAVSPDGRTLASGGVLLPPPSWAGRAVLQTRAFFAEAQWRATHEVVLVDLATGQRLARAAGAAAPRFAPDGRDVATLGRDNTWTIRAVPAAGR